MRAGTFPIVRFGSPMPGASIFARLCATFVLAQCFIHMSLGLHAKREQLVRLCCRKMHHPGRSTSLQLSRRIITMVIATAGQSVWDRI